MQARLGCASTATVLIVDDDHAGAFGFASEKFKVAESKGVFIAEVSVVIEQYLSLVSGWQNGSNNNRNIASVSCSNISSHYTMVAKNPDSTTQSYANGKLEAMHNNVSTLMNANTASRIGNLSDITIKPRCQVIIVKTCWYYFNPPPSTVRNE